MKRLNPIETDQYILDVIECSCGFHIGLDATYIDQVADVYIGCPSCQAVISSNDAIIKLTEISEDNELTGLQDISWKRN